MRVAIIILILLPFSILGDQAVLFGNLTKKIEKESKEAIEADHFSAVSISVWKKGVRVLSVNEGWVNSKTPDKKVTEKTVFDLASLTKPLVVLTLFLELEKNGLLNRNWLISKFYPEITREITLFDLLTHKSGLPAYADFFKCKKENTLEKKKKRVVEYICKNTKTYSNRYSDINYILLGFVIEKVTGKSLDHSFKELLSKKFPSIKSFSYSPLKNGVDVSKVAATSFSPHRGRVVQGEVEDENSVYLDGISGHAGLFGTADDISHFYSLLLKDKFYRKVIVEQIGFDKKEGANSNFGSVATTDCSGHLGWSGTAFLICPKDEIVVTILTNRTHSNKFKKEDFTNIKAFRRSVFDAVLLESKKYF
ncbi:MAG: serine hydrolase domain-containing protein [bacterium]